ncbi:MAG: helix-turn-helix domain-containing protein [Zoogloea oleivorans]|jgi:HTH-type transcriptional regulator/antitoxin HipB|uniref:helix-turn-helix domain-containing protein n=1 Tax=Zoogloea oleivorans TaxID=1552750 RepID=UPI002A370BD6|nr:helix-turn-helix domain-containing protein [Zoogloea oleivorans]MDY0037775.1 helix-turn-helix domain-containing protein [Zoogloea oleivorans]
MDYIVRTPDQLAKYLKALRQTRGESQSALAQRLGVSQARYSAMELRPEKVAVEGLLALLSGLGVELVLRDKDEGDQRPPAPSQPEW